MRRPARLDAGQGGYTLTEMLVVIGIISLIAAVLTPGLLSQMGRARAKAAQLQLETVASSVELFRTDIGRYPTAAEGLQVLVAEPPEVEGWSGPYLRDRKALTDPWGHPIVYEPSAEGGAFAVKSLGSDGKSGGSGVARDLRAPAG